ncbi:MAG: hypothetical protein QG671_1303 [Actinomycetota bacterium]|nr:hypothetical protein [Actinomycetota bacterium]
MSDLNLGTALRSFRRSTWRLETSDHLEEYRRLQQMALNTAVSLHAWTPSAAVLGE